VEVAFAGRDAFAPSAVVGVLIALPDDPIELGASIGWAQRARIQADADATTAGTSASPTIMRVRPGATLDLHAPWTLRAGARYLGERFVMELGGDLWLVPERAAAATWAVHGLRVVDRSGVGVDLTEVASRASLRTHGAVRGALDVELIGGFLWATTGYAFAVGGVAGGRQSPTFGDLGGHTVALGLEATAAGVTFSLGWSRTWSVARRDLSVLALDNPFGAGDRAVPIGRYDGSIDQIGILLDAELGSGD
nr:hypothetical protein [Myxococcota bacterium]